MKKALTIAGAFFTGVKRAQRAFAAAADAIGEPKRRF
tara:strand:+ start:47957 stop:48067 length:111 start_codon:yes stop_codon:yes gene_type:complete